MSKLPRRFRFQSSSESLQIPQPITPDRMLVAMGVTLGEGECQTLGGFARKYAALEQAHRLYVWSLVIVGGKLITFVDMDSIAYDS